jgi:hypothetical protein
MCRKWILCWLLICFSVAARQSATRSEDMSGLKLRLSQAAEPVERPRREKLSAAEPLAESHVAEIFKRLPPLRSEPERGSFLLPRHLVPPPRAGKVITDRFPPAESQPPPSEPKVGALEVVRFAPEGEIPLAPHLSVTFSEPMVSLTSHAELVSQLPVRLTPQPRGRWRWIGTQTLLFEPEGRFPMATTYKVEIPAGTKSAIGGTLKESKAWSFATPPASIKRSHPQGDSQPRDPIFFIEFDQRIDPEAVLSKIRILSGSASWGARLASRQEIESDPAASRMVKTANKDCWLAFRPASQLPANAVVTVLVEPGTPSAEGPRVTETEQKFSFRTYGPLRVLNQLCLGECLPQMPWSIQFSNPLDAGSFEQSQIQIEPELADMRAEIYGDKMIIQGRSRGRTTYRVRLSRNIRDQFGQTLGQDLTLTFNVTSALPQLTSPADTFVVLDPYGPLSFPIYTINYESLKVRLYSVGPENWNGFLRYLRDREGDLNLSPPGRLVRSDTIKIEARPDELTETHIDLKPALEDGLGQVIILVEPADQKPWRPDRQRYQIAAWVQATQIGLDAFVDRSELLVWATSLKDGRPLEGVQIELLPAGLKATTRADATARLELKPDIYKGSALIVARKGKDIAILPEITYSWFDWHKEGAPDLLRWHVFDDRKMYRPGEEVCIKGWIRLIGGGKSDWMKLPNGAVTSIDYVLKDPRGNEMARGSRRVNAFGGFHVKLRLPRAMNLGSASLELKAQGAEAMNDRSYTHTFQVQEFRRPEFEVTAQSSAGPHFVGGWAKVTVSANYYAGGGLPGAPVRWLVTSEPTNYTPPNRSDFVFGRWTPWWREDYYEEKQEQEFRGETDASGNHTLRIDFDSVAPPQASAVTAEASVTDINRQTWTASVNLLVHPSELYVGLKSERFFVQKGEPISIQAIVTDIDGNAIAGRTIKMRAAQLDWVFERGRWVQKEKDPQERSVISAAQPAKCTFQARDGGLYRITATVLDDRERPNRTELTIWVAGGKLPPDRSVAQQEVELIPDRKEYRPGEEAQVLIQAPFYPAEGLMTLRRSGIVRAERFRIESPSDTLKIPILEDYIPNVHLQVDLVGATDRADEGSFKQGVSSKRPAFASGTISLKVPPFSRKLSVKVEPRAKALEPGQEAWLDIQVRDALGKPAPGEVAIVVVDEAILALTGYKLPDPLETFYFERGADTRDYHSRGELMLATAEWRSRDGQLMLVAPALSRLSKEEPVALIAAESAGPIRVRMDFNPLAAFMPSVRVGLDGRAQVKFKLPDNLTRYRIAAVAVSGGELFGMGESTITARLPLMVRPSAPRFLNFGDRFELPVVVQNQTDSPMQVEVAIRATNIELTGGRGRRITIPANDRVEVSFPASTIQPGKARFQLVAVSQKLRDAAEIEVPVWAPAATEAFATYGQIDSGAIAQMVKAPPNAIEQFGGLEITTSSTQLEELTDAVIYLASYPFDCSEQLASRILAVASLRDVLAAFRAEGLPGHEELTQAVTRDIEQLSQRQNHDGGFGLWRRGEDSWPYVSIHVAHALWRAKENGFTVPETTLSSAQKYLREIEKHIPDHYGSQIRQALIAYALYVRDRMGEKDAIRARRLIADLGLEKLPLEAVGWLLAVLSGDPNSKSEVQAARRLLLSRVEETAGAAHFTTSYQDGEHLLMHSSRRADGIILEALIEDQPDSDLIPKIVRGLLAHRKSGRWSSTQENAFILLALSKYFATYEERAPDFVARAWLGDLYAGGHQFRGRSTSSHRISIPMKLLAEFDSAQKLTLSKEGAGKLYYRIGLQYAPKDLQLEASDHGFTVERLYEAVDDPGDVWRSADGIWHIKAGARVRVRLTMVAPARRYHVALVDRMPAGLEAISPEIAIAGTENHGRWWWMGPWFEHQNIRDDRVEAFASLLWEGIYNYSYVARATTPGHFIAPPPKVEEMYSPETFGRGRTDRIIIE